MHLQRIIKALAWPTAILLWLVITVNFLIFNRYAYQPTQLIKYGSVFLSVITFYLITKHMVGYIKTRRPAGYKDYLLLIIMPFGMAPVAYFTLYALGSTATVISGVFKADNELHVSVTDKRIKEYVPAGGCRYTIDLNLKENGTKINNHCISSQLFDYFSSNEEYIVMGSESLFGTVIYEINGIPIKTVPRLNRY